MNTVYEQLCPFLKEMPAGRCLAGFSGGADSTALIFLLAGARDERGIYPEAIHVNHGLRGSESDEDESFCRRICEELSIPFHSMRIDLQGKTDENACRQERFRCFEEILNATGIRQLVLGHNRDDAAETFMMRLMRGSGSKGLAGMSPNDTWNGFSIYRPLLNISREQIRKVLQASGISWREDSLNRDPAYLRNRVRSKLIPLMEEMAPGVSSRIAQTASLLRDDDDFLQSEAEKYLMKHSAPCWLDIRTLGEIPRPVCVRILRTWWRENMPATRENALDARKTAELLDLVKKDRGKVNLPGGLFAVRGKRGLFITGQEAEEQPEIPYEPVPIQFGKFVLHTLPTEGSTGDGIVSQEVPRDILTGCSVRTRRPGDRIRPFGMNGSRKLQDYMVDRGIDEPWRDRIPLLCRGNEVIWVAGVGTGSVPRWDPDADNVRLMWTGKMPWNMTVEEEIHL